MKKQLFQLPTSNSRLPEGPRLGVGNWVWTAITTATVVVIAGGSPVFACPVCFGAEETSMIDGAKLGVLVMLAITLAVQGGFLGFFLYLRRHAKRNADVELDMEWADLQRGSRRS